jgi:hypothetical protein
VADSFFIAGPLSAMDTQSVVIHADVLEVFPEPVEQVIIGLHSRGRPAGREDAFSTNHAALFLVFANGERCVRLDMVPTNFGGMLMVKAHNYAMSASVLQTYPLLAANGRRVQDFWQAIEQDSLHLFQFEVTEHDDRDDEVHGCRN